MEDQLREAIQKEMSKVQSGAIVQGAKMMAFAFMDEFKGYKNMKKSDLVEIVDKMVERCDFILKQ